METASLKANMKRENRIENSQAKKMDVTNKKTEKYVNESGNDKNEQKCINEK